VLEALERGGFPKPKEGGNNGAKEGNAADSKGEEQGHNEDAGAEEEHQEAIQGEAPSADAACEQGCALGRHLCG
jgi:hypothetical protein